MEKFKEIFNKKGIRYLSYFFISMVMILFVWLVGQIFNINQFLEITELKTLDLRFGMSKRYIEPNKNIVILTIDDESTEILVDEYGRWPWSRNIYTKLINYLESGGVDLIGFDLMFVGHQKGFEYIDKELAHTIGKYDNAYVSMNFDYTITNNPPNLPKNLTVNVENNSSNINFSNLNFTNCRLILNEIIQSTKNIGIINLKPDKIDGVSRRAPIFIKYKNDYYPYLAFKMAYNYLKKYEGIDTSKFVINNNNELILGKRKIPLDENGLILLNWYGPDEKTFTHIPFWKVMRSIKDIEKGKKPYLSPDFFKNKIVFVGTTAVAMYDLKSVPVNNIYPGVGIQATLFNNIIDNVPVKKVPNVISFLICLLLGALTGMLVIKLRSTLISSVTTIIIATLYILIASILLQRFYYWIEVVNPVIMIILTFTFTYIIKYIMKSRDFEYTYKLATTDGLTNLYNHRYFQEQLTNSIDRASRYKTNFSIILIDIDFFKKFNDTYGHQAGDAVLRQVADTLKKSVRSLDLVARYGGEEMAIILDNANTDEAVTIANKICKIVASKTFRLSESIEKNVTISLGVATFPHHGETGAQLIEFADQGLYRAKENGRNQVGALSSEQKEEQTT